MWGNDRGTGAHDCGTGMRTDERRRSRRSRPLRCSRARSNSSGSTAPSSSGPSSATRSRWTPHRTRRRAAAPGRRAVLLFHIVADGGCWVSGPDGDRHRAEAGDVIVVAVRRRPHADGRVAGGTGVTRSPCWHRHPGRRCRRSSSAAPAPRRVRVRVSRLGRPVARSAPGRVPARVRGPAPGAGRAQWVEASVTYAMQGVVARGGCDRRRRGHAAARARRHRGLQGAPRVHTGRGPRMARGAARPGARARAGRAARRAERHWTVGRSRRRPRCRGRCSTSASGRCSGDRPSGTSPSGGCTSRASCSPAPTPRCSRSPAGSATTPRRRSAARSSASTERRPATGGPRAGTRGHRMNAEEWDRRYDRDEYVWHVAPNRFLPDLVADLPRRPGARRGVRRGSQRGVARAAGLVGHRDRLLRGGRGEGRAAGGGHRGDGRVGRGRRDRVGAAAGRVRARGPVLRAARGAGAGRHARSRGAGARAGRAARAGRPRPDEPHRRHRRSAGRDGAADARARGRGPRRRAVSPICGSTGRSASRGRSTPPTVRGTRSTASWSPAADRNWHARRAGKSSILGIGSRAAVTSGASGCRRRPGRPRRSCTGW